MAKKISLIGLSIDELYGYRNEKVQTKCLTEASPAGLIPTQKAGDEVALTSVFLSALRLIKEFRRLISDNINLNIGRKLTSRKVHVFTETKFSGFDSARLDGLICIEQSGKVKDAALFEMKNCNNTLDSEQIERYAEIADAFSIPRIITVSNQFVSKPTQSPVTLSPRKKTTLYHLSWTFILTLAQILLSDNSLNIEDPDQVEIMHEVVRYFENDKSGVKGFTSMKDGWKDLTVRIRKGGHIKPSDPDVIEAAESWVQEERDMALVLSRKLGILVETGVKKYADNWNARIENEAKKIAQENIIETTLYVADAASPITVKADFKKRNVEFQTVLETPRDNFKIRGQVGWIRRQIKKMEEKNPEIFDLIQNDLSVTLKLKNSARERISFEKLDQFIQDNKGRILSKYGFVLHCDLGQNFGSPTKSIKIIEKSLILYYQGIVQHLDKWIPPTPEIKEPDEEPNLSSEA